MLRAGYDDVVDSDFVKGSSLEGVGVCMTVCTPSRGRALDVDAEGIV